MGSGLVFNSEKPSKVKLDSLFVLAQFNNQ